MKIMLAALSLALVSMGHTAFAEESAGGLKFQAMVDGKFIPAVSSSEDSARLILVQSTTSEAEQAAESTGQAAESAADAAGQAAQSAADAAGEAADAASDAADSAMETAEAAPQTMDDKIDSLRSEMRALIEQSQAGAEEMVEKVSNGAAVTEDQVYGIGVGIVVGALAADLMGFGGLATLAVAAGGGLVGNWVMSDGGGGGDHQPEAIDDLADELSNDMSGAGKSQEANKGEMSL